MRKQEYENLLDIIPVKNEEIDWIIIDNDTVQIVIKRDSWMDRLVRKFKKNSQNFRVDLDKYGSAVWMLIDGKRNVKQIAQELKKSFGDDIEPLYERLGQYINILNTNKYIRLN